VAYEIIDLEEDSEDRFPGHQFQVVCTEDTEIIATFLNRALAELFLKAFNELE